jgi:DNA gyrase subunit A
VNGAGGIAVGMATNIPPHNLGEIVDAAVALIGRPDMSVEELTEIVPGPDFPTGGSILGRGGIRSPTGRAVARSSCARRWRSRQVRRDREAIIVTEIPYQVNKSTLIEKIAELVREKRIEGISDLRDESEPRRRADRHRAEARRRGGRGAEPAVALHAASIHVWRNMMALNGGRPEQLNLKDA